jgi:hypothetical protein
MRRILLLLMALLLAAPLLSAKVTKRHPHAATHHAKNAQYPKKRGKNPEFQQARGRKHTQKPAQKHPKNPHARKAKKSKRHKR